MAAVARYYSPAEPNNQALEAAMELSMINISSSNINNGLLNLAAAAGSPSSGPPPNAAAAAAAIGSVATSSVEGCFDFWGDGGGCTAELEACKTSPCSLNITQCVAVPSSEHVAEIVGKQGECCVVGKQEPYVDLPKNSVCENKK